MKSFFRALFAGQQSDPSPAQDEQPLSGCGFPDSEGIALQGNIAVIPLEDLFQLVDFAALTGKLEVQAPANSGTFFFKKGVLIYGLLRVHQRRIGQILLDSRIISEGQLQECLRLHEGRGDRPRLGRLLVEKGYIDPGKLNDSLQRQIKEAFFEALSWHEGTFAFYQDRQPGEEEVLLSARVDRLLLEGMVHIDQAGSPPG